VDDVTATAEAFDDESAGPIDALASAVLDRFRALEKKAVAPGPVNALVADLVARRIPARLLSVEVKRGPPRADGHSEVHVANGHLAYSIYCILFFEENASRNEA